VAVLSWHTPHSGPASVSLTLLERRPHHLQVRCSPRSLSRLGSSRSTTLAGNAPDSCTHGHLLRPTARGGPPGPRCMQGATHSQRHDRNRRGLAWPPSCPRLAPLQALTRCSSRATFMLPECCLTNLRRCSVSEDLRAAGEGTVAYRETV
jgi:hypothetical protein